MNTGFSPLVRDEEHQQELASRVNARLRKNAKDRKENRERQEGVEIPAHRELSRRAVQTEPSPAFGTSRRRVQFTRKRTGLTGAEKRRKRKGGNPNGGPGSRGLFSQTCRSRRGYLDPFITEKTPHQMQIMRRDLGGRAA